MKAGYPRLLQTRLMKTEGGWIEQRSLPASCKAVFDVLADHSNNKGVSALSLSEIAAATGYTVQTIRTATRRLAKCRLILIERTGNGPGVKLRYCIRFFYRVFLQMRNALRKLLSEFSTDKGIQRPSKVMGDKIKNPKDAPAPSAPPGLMGRLRRIVEGNASLSTTDRRMILSCVGQLVKQGKFHQMRSRWTAFESLILQRLLDSAPGRFADYWPGASYRERFRVFRLSVLAAIQAHKPRHSEALNRVNARMRSLHQWAQSVDEWSDDRCEWLFERQSETIHELDALNLSSEQLAGLIAQTHWKSSLCLA